MLRTTDEPLLKPALPIPFSAPHRTPDENLVLTINLCVELDNTSAQYSVPCTVLACGIWQRKSIIVCRVRAGVSLGPTSAGASGPTLHTGIKCMSIIWQACNMISCCNGRDLIGISVWMIFQLAFFSGVPFRVCSDMRVFVQLPLDGVYCPSSFLLPT